MAKGKCTWVWNTKLNPPDWDQKEKCKKGSCGGKPPKPPHGKPDPKDGDMIIRYCK
jgi:hypothetical protein